MGVDVTISEVTSVLGVCVSVLGWVVTATLNKNNTVRAAENSRRWTAFQVLAKETRDAVQTASEHLMSAGDDLDGEKRIRRLHKFSRDINSLQKDAFQIAPNNINDYRVKLWELLTGDAVNDKNRQPLPIFDRRIREIADTAERYLTTCRDTLRQQGVIGNQ